MTEKCSSILGRFFHKIVNKLLPHVGQGRSLIFLLEVLEVNKNC